MRNKNLPSRAWKHVQRNTPSNESLDFFAAAVGMWWALRRAQKGQREMTEAVDRMLRTEEEIASARTGEQSSTSEGYFGETREASPSTSSAHRHAADGDGLFKYLVLYGLTLVLQPVLAVVLTLAALWGLWKAVLWLFLS